MTENNIKKEIEKHKEIMTNIWKFSKRQNLKI